MKLIARKFASALLASAVAAGSYASIEMSPKISPPSHNSAMFRWWLPAAMVDDIEIEQQLQEVADGGFKGVEICIHLGDTNYPRSMMDKVGWGTPRWNSLYKHILKTANRLGLQVDTTISPAWPAAVPTHEPADISASKVLLTGSTRPFRGSFSGEVPIAVKAPRAFGPPPGAPNAESDDQPAHIPPSVNEKIDHRINNPRQLIAVTAAKIVASEVVTKPILMAWGDMPHDVRNESKVASLLESDSMQVVTSYHLDKTTGKYQINWTAPDDGEWQLFSFWMEGTGQQNKEGASTFKHNYVVDHLNEHGAQAMIDFWNEQLLDSETKQLLRDNGGAIFEDSLELEYDGGIMWTSDMLMEFKQHRGYEITPYLPLITSAAFNGIGDNSVNTYELADNNNHYSNRADRIRRDFNETLTTLYIQEHVAPLDQWAQSLGLSYRAQTYGMGFDVMAAASAASGPDGESLGFGPSVQGDDRFRMISGGAHLGERAIIADEVGAIANEGYRLTWLDMLQWINKNLSTGANQMVFHGMAYPDSNSARWPGVTPFGFGLAGYWGPRNPDWQHINALSEYLSRVQTALQGGVAVVDLAVLKMHYGTSAPLLNDQSLAENGYSYDFISPNLLRLPSAIVNNQRLAAAGPAYKALIVDRQTQLPSDSIQYLQNMADNGLPIFFVGSVPEQSAYFANQHQNDTAFATAIQDLLKSPTVKRVSNMSEVIKQLSKLRISPAFNSQNKDLITTRRDNAEVSYYFVHNRGAATVKNTVVLEGTGNSYQIDPWTGNKQLLGRTGKQFELSLLSGESTLIAVMHNETPNKQLASKPNFVHTHNLVDWKYHVVDWTENSTTPKPSDTQKTTFAVKSNQLTPWRQLPELSDATSGIGYYKTQLSLTNWSPERKAQLQLGSIGQSSSVQVSINGQKAPVNLYRLSADIGHLLKVGHNEISIEVASTLGNRLIEQGAITAPVWNPDARIDYEDYGLLGPVTVRTE